MSITQQLFPWIKATHPKAFQVKPWLAKASVAVVLGLLSFQPSVAAQAGNAYMPIRHTGPDDPMQGMMIPRERNRKSLNQIYEFDRSPLGTRIPVILLPGRAEEFQHDSWWKRFHIDTQKDDYFRTHFKLYAFLYNSKEELDVQADSFAVDLQKRFGHLPKQQPIMLVVYSLGGVIAREIFEDCIMLDKVDSIFAISVPFHGSPIFEPAWYSGFLNPPNRSPVRRFWDRSLYRLYMFDKSNLTRGMGWDNFDGSMPQFHIDNTPHIIGDQLNTAIPAFEEYRNADAIRRKTVIYASYIENLHTQPNLSQEQLRFPRYMLSGPAKVLGSVFPLYGLTVHSVLNYTNYTMANLPTYTSEDPQGRNINLYRFNDGAIPLSSMLFLKPSQEPYTGGIWDLVSKAEVRKARIFLNLDHVDVGEYNWRKASLLRNDLIHPDEGMLTPNGWIIKDLNERMELLKSGKLQRLQDAGSGCCAPSGTASSFRGEMMSPAGKLPVLQSDETVEPAEATIISAPSSEPATPATLPAEPKPVTERVQDRERIAQPLLK